MEIKIKKEMEIDYSRFQWTICDLIEMIIIWNDDDDDNDDEDDDHEETNQNHKLINLWWKRK